MIRNYAFTENLQPIVSSWSLMITKVHNNLANVYDFVWKNNVSTTKSVISKENTMSKLSFM